VEDVPIASNSFSMWQIRHGNREANKAAHGLAQVAIKQVIDITWLEDILICINYIVLAEQLLCQ
jgi:hypothetical protein